MSTQPDDQQAAFYCSVITIGPALVVAVPMLVGIVVFGGIVAWALVVVLVVLLTLLTLQRVQFDAEALTFIAVLPLLPRQPLRFADLGPFRLNSSWFASNVYRLTSYRVIEARIERGPRFRVLYVWPRRKLTFTAIPGTGTLGRASAEDLISLFERSRENTLRGSMSPRMRA